MPLTDHPLRLSLTEELHARPFPRLAVPGRALYIAYMPRDAEAAAAHLAQLTGACLPAGTSHHTAPYGAGHVKWEQHTEFTTYTFLSEDGAPPALPEDWLTALPGQRIAAAVIEVIAETEDSRIAQMVAERFSQDGLAVTRVMEEQMVLAGDFRLDGGGQSRFCLFTRPDMGAGRIGRVVQRICEIETYRIMSMLGLASAREISPALARLDTELTRLSETMGAEATPPEEVLHQLLDIGADLERLAARVSFRFAATEAYERIVHDRIAVLDESRFAGRPGLAEFMMRRYDPAMRTARATRKRLDTLSARAARAGDLLRTRVDVGRSAENQALLRSMDRRADLQLRLQQTVEGLSVVAISYYALGLASYVLAPVAKALAIDKGLLIAGTVPLVVGAVWLMIRRIHKSMH